MKNEKIANFKRFAILIISILSLFIFSSCVITSPMEDAGGAGDTLDYSALINGVYEEGIISANFQVELSSFNLSIFGEKEAEATSKGSGVIFSVDGLDKPLGLYTYYLLTNNHVIYKSDKYTNFEYTVIDCYGESYEAKLEYSDPDFDLAVLSFKCREDYKVLEFALFNPKKSDVVISMGGPLGVINAVTVGKVVDYAKITLSAETGVGSDMSNVQFEVIKHSAYVNGGSSGGVLLDEDYRICGINYAAELDDDGAFVHGYAVPLEKVVEFINMQNQ